MKSAILKTLLYADIFDYPLKKEQIWQWLVWQKRAKPSKKDFEKALQELVEEKKIYRVDSFYLLPGRKKIVAIRKKRRRRSSKKLIIAKRIGRIIAIIPFVKFVGITGALAMKNSDENDDIDFLIIAQRGRLWTTRFLVTILLNILGVRRKPGDKKFKDKICLNMFLEENYFDIAKPNIFQAHEILQLKPLINKYQTYEKFLRANEWVGKYLPNRFSIVRPRLASSTFWVPAQKSAVWRDCGHSRLENLLYQFQLFLMRRRKTTEVVARHLIKFHPEDQEKRVIELFEKKYRDIEI